VVEVVQVVRILSGLAGYLEVVFLLVLLGLGVEVVVVEVLPEQVMVASAVLVVVMVEEEVPEVLQQVPVLMALAAMVLTVF